MASWNDRSRITKLRTRLQEIAAYLAAAEAVIQTELPVTVTTKPVRLIIADRRIEVRSRSKGDWQVHFHEPLREDTFAVVLVDFTVEGPAFYVIGKDSFTASVRWHHQEFLAGRPQRPQTPDSEHHKVTTEQVAEWRGRWDIIGGAASTSCSE